MMLTAAWAALSTAAALPNMNGSPVFSATPGGSYPSFPKQFKDYPATTSGEGIESFDAYTAPMTTLYSQVWWRALEPTSFPSEIVQRYKGRSMAIIGWEIDQVRRTPDGDVSVPISASYNHHYVAGVIGASAKFKRVTFEGPDDPRLAKMQSAHGMPIPWDQPHYIVEDDDPAPGHRQQFSSGNGGEYRKTFHGFAPGYAMVIDSPTAFQVTPMQIDTWNREEMNISGKVPPKFVPGPLPRAALSPPDAQHSGLLECPLTTRVAKVVDQTYVFRLTGSCPSEPIFTYHECFYAAAKTLSDNASSAPLTFVNQTSRSPNRPPGCSYSSSPGTPIYVFFNGDLASTAMCGPDDVCVCPATSTPFGRAKGVLRYTPTSQAVDIGNGTAQTFDGHKCAEYPATTLLNQSNPTCDIRHYVGGQWACHHMWSLLDADQRIPWTDQPLVFHHKYRFFVQPYDPALHTKVTLGETHGSIMLIGSPWEFDVPKCAPGIKGCSLVDGTWIHTVSGSMMGNHTFVTLNNHCHAPTCLSVQVFACAKGTRLEDCNAATGKLICQTSPVYGGSGNPAIAGTRFDEPGYIAIPDCIWGDKQYGLEPPVNLDHVPLHVVKTANATWGHYGEMSGGQPWVIL